MRRLVAATILLIAILIGSAAAGAGASLRGALSDTR